MAGLSLLVMHMNATLSESRSMVQVECCVDVSDTALMARGQISACSCTQLSQASDHYTHTTAFVFGSDYAL